MIKNIFIPNVISSYYIFSQRIVGFDIGKTYVQATVVKAYRNKRVIEKFLQERILEESELSYQERVSKVIARILDQVEKYDLIYTSLPSGLVIFKELSVPFTQLDKIKMILPYEVGPMLPFSLDLAVIDCVITNTYKEENRSDLLVAIVKKEAFIQHMQFFEAIGVHPKKVTIDLFELYGLYASIPFYSQTNGVIALVDIGYYSTRIAIIVDGQLKHIRSVLQGLLALAKDNHDQTLVFEKEKMQQFMNNIQFTLQSYKEKVEDENLVVSSKIIFTGHGAEIQGLVEVLESVCNHNCEIFHPNKLLQKDTITIDNNQNIPQAFVVSLGTALSLFYTQDFNLSHTQSTIDDERLFNRQIIVALALILLMMGGLVLDTWFMKRKFNSEIELSTQDALSKLKSNFEKLKKHTKSALSLKKANDTAEDEVKKEDAILSQLLRKDRISFLACLEELSRKIDRDSLNFKISKLVINDQSRQITLDGKVKDYKELGILEEDLRRSKIFKFLTPRLQDTTFEIKLGINDNYGK